MLEALGVKYSISREHVRQIETGIRAKLGDYSGLGMCAESVDRTAWLMHLEQVQSLLRAWFTPAEISTVSQPDMPTPCQLLRAAGVT